MMGEAQERWLYDGLVKSRTNWQVLANQVRIAPFDETPGEGRRFSMDQWSGYPHALERLSRAIAERAPNRTVAITGDIHSNWVNELRARNDRPDAPIVGAEFVGTSITSGGDGRDEATNWNDKTRAENPHCKWQNSRRGYVVCEFGADDCRADYRTVPFVTQQGAALQKASSWRVIRGRPGIQRV
jgi:alkaline phosphatase D